uniref:RRM domain-containing protein n=1 Tax=Elaeophora elaphi TaxID=1147741 RepID=A0A0R3RW58_9BILA
MGIIGSIIADTVDDTPIPDANEVEKTAENGRDSVLTLGQNQGIDNLRTANESSLSTANGLLSDRSSNGNIIAFSSCGNDDSDNDDKETTSSTTPCENYLQEWTPQYSSSLSIFATLSSGNFLSENEVTEVFSRYGNIKEVKWIQISDSNGYIIVFSNEDEKENAIKVPKIRILISNLSSN